MALGVADGGPRFGRDPIELQAPIRGDLASRRDGGPAAGAARRRSAAEKIDPLSPVAPMSHVLIRRDISRRTTISRPGVSGACVPRYV